MPRVYRAVAPHTSQTVQIDLFELNVGAARSVKLLEVHVSQTSDVKDAEEEMLLVHIKEAATTSGSGGSTATPIPASKGDPAAISTVEVSNTTKATGGTPVTHLSQAWNVRVPLDIIFTPETAIELPAGARLTVEIGTTPADAITIGGYIVFSEIG